MILSVVQFEPNFGNVEANYQVILRYVQCTKCDIIVFPELCITGYDFISRDEAIEYSYAIKEIINDKLKILSQDTGKVIVLGYPENKDGRIYNAATVFFPQQEYNYTYRKTHLFFRERFIFDEGDSGFVVKYYPPLDINIGTMICYDWRFPEAARTLALRGADLIVCPSNLVTNVWHIATPARALENKVYLAVSNRIGIENRNGAELLFNGGSRIYSFNGSELAKSPNDKESIISAEIIPEKTRDKSFNEFNDIFADRRTGYYL